jgi:hypothetical protein
LAILLQTILRVACPTVKNSALNPTSGETLVKSTVNDLDIILKRR